MLETEVKFYLKNKDTVREAILALGAHSRGRAFESNIRFEDSNKSLIQRKSLLRLRQDKKCTLTFKSPLKNDDSQYKIFNELEVNVSDFDTMQNILESVGFYPEQIYEKRRETLVLDNSLFCIDAMPYGNFLEIEGPRSDIRNFAHLLKLDWKKRILMNYLEIFANLRKKLQLKFSDVTFKNFESINLNFSDYTHLFEAGD